MSKQEGRKRGEKQDRERVRERGPQSRKDGMGRTTERKMDRERGEAQNNKTVWTKDTLSGAHDWSIVGFSRMNVDLSFS